MYINAFWKSYIGEISFVSICYNICVWETDWVPSKYNAEKAKLWLTLDSFWVSYLPAVYKLYILNRIQTTLSIALLLHVSCSMKCAKKRQQVKCLILYVNWPMSKSWSRLLKLRVCWRGSINSAKRSIFVSLDWKSFQIGFCVTSGISSV